MTRLIIQLDITKRFHNFLSQNDEEQAAELQRSRTFFLFALSAAQRARRNTTADTINARLRPRGRHGWQAAGKARLRETVAE